MVKISGRPLTGTKSTFGDFRSDSEARIEGTESTPGAREESGLPELETKTAWWFGTMEFYDVPYIGHNSTDELHHFSEG